MTTITKATDIRDTLPTAVKGGTSSKPVWDIGGVPHAFVKPLKATGLKADGSKPRLGKRVLGKYEVATTSPSVPEGKLEFVGMFRVIK